MRRNVDRPSRRAHRRLEPVARVRRAQLGLPGGGARGVRRRRGRAARRRWRAIRRSARRWRGRAASRSRAPSTSSPPARRAARRAGAAGPTSSASYWQRYCSKNDTIGFFGPLAWGSFAEHGDAIAVRSGALERERVVHFETWAMEAVAAAAGRQTAAADGPVPRARAAPAARRHVAASTAWRSRATRSRRRRATASPPRSTQLDRVFEEVTGRPPRTPSGDSGGGRTIAYLDCMRDLDVTLGPAVLDELRELAAARPARVALVVRARVRPRRRAARADRARPLGPARAAARPS